MADTSNKKNKGGTGAGAAPQSTTMGGGGSAADGPTAAGGGGAASSSSLAATYPVNTLMEIKLAPAGEIIRGLVYCTDETSNSVVFKKSLAHTTLASEITVINAASVLERKPLLLDVVGKKENNEEMARELAGMATSRDMTMPLPNVSRRALEERERRAVRLAEESFSHVNQRASPEGQKIFDKLLKACNEVVWRGESILVLKEIRVDPPYAAENCALINNNEGMGAGGGLDAHSLERVKKIVAASKS